MAKSAPSKTEIDRLGDRLRKAVSPADLRALDAYRRTFSPAYDSVLREIRETMGMDISGRPAKSTSAIIEKLNRESIRLSQIQDIAGCRVVVDNRATQDSLALAIVSRYASAHIADRRETPSHGYRAVHVIVRVDGHPIEVQIRTQLQHLWAELSEKAADRHGFGLKYGKGKVEVLESLNEMSTQVHLLEIGRVAGQSSAEKARVIEVQTTVVKAALLDLIRALGDRQ